MNIASLCHSPTTIATFQKTSKDAVIILKVKLFGIAL
jgi:hypothetical protein